MHNRHGLWGRTARPPTVELAVQAGSRLETVAERVRGGRSPWTSSSVRLAHPGLAAGVDVSPAAAAELVAGSSDGGLQAVRNRRGRHRPLRRAGRPPDRGGPARGPDEDVHAGSTGRREHAQRTRRPKTTKLYYDRPADTVAVDEIERIVI